MILCKAHDATYPGRFNLIFYYLLLRSSRSPAIEVELLHLVQVNTKHVRGCAHSAIEQQFFLLSWCMLQHRSVDKLARRLVDVLLLSKQSMTNTATPYTNNNYAFQSVFASDSLLYIFVLSVCSSAMAANIPACPPSLKPIAHYLKTAQEHGNWMKWCCSSLMLVAFGRCLCVYEVCDVWLILLHLFVPWANL